MNDESKTGTTNWVRSHLAAIGSAAVISVYAAGYVRTNAAAARVADETPPPRRPVARTPITRVEIAKQPAPRPAASDEASAAEARVARQPAPTPQDASNARTSAAKPSKVVAPKAQTAHVETPKAVNTDASPSPAAPPAPAAPAAPADTAPARAAANPQPADSAAHVAYKDGVFAGWGTSRHGDIEATVEVKDGRIVSAMITQCLTRYSCSWISALPPQVVERQSAEVDYVSGATESSNAFYGAVAQALGKAK